MLKARTRIAFLKESRIDTNWHRSHSIWNFLEGAAPVRRTGIQKLGTQNIGWNRVTQDLVDNQNYVAGTPLVNLSSNGYNIGAKDIQPNTLASVCFSAEHGGAVLGSPDLAELYALDPATVHTVKLPLNRIMIDEGDFTHTTTGTAYFDMVYDIKPGVTFKNQSFYDGMDHKKYSSYGFGAGYNPWTVENKSTLTFAWKPGNAFNLDAQTGFTVHRVEVAAGEERDWYQVIDRRDLSIGARPNDRFQGPFNSNGQISFQYFQKGSYKDVGAYWLSDARLWKRLNATAGFRVDRYSPDSTGRFSGEALARGTATDTAVTYNASLSYRLPIHLRTIRDCFDVAFPRSRTG